MKIVIILLCTNSILNLGWASIGYCRHPKLTKGQKFKSILPMVLCVVAVGSVIYYETVKQLIGILYFMQFTANFATMLAITLVFQQVQNKKFLRFGRILGCFFTILHIAKLAFLVMAFIPVTGPICTKEIPYPYIFELISVAWSMWFFLLTFLYCKRGLLIEDKVIKDSATHGVLNENDKNKIDLNVHPLPHPDLVLYN